MDPERRVISHGVRALPKRSRAALACNACRKVKSKCDGGRPVCGRCSRQSTECTYTLNVHDRRMDRQEERRAHLALKQKVSQLEAQLAAAPEAAASADHPDPLPMGDSGGDDGPSSLPDASDSALSHRGISYSGPSGALADDAGSQGTNTGSAVDALATGAFDHRPAAEIGYFGPTSNHAMFRAVTNAMVNSGYRLTVLRQHEQDGEPGTKQPSFQAPSAAHIPAPVPQEVTSMGGQNRHQSRRPIASQTIWNDNYMPSQAVARKWVTRFFDTVGSVLPYVNEAALLREIDAGPQRGFDTGRSDGRHRSMTPRAMEGLLNIVFAHALVALPAGQGQDEVAAEPFYHRAVALLLQEEQAVSTPTTQTVQALLLLGSFQQNSQRAMASLATHALAVKASYQLGLHSPATYDGLSSSDKELRAKLWFAVVNQDMILGTALGRPCLIPPGYVQYKMLDSVSPETMQPAVTTNLSLPSSNESVYYFRYLSSLHQIMGHAVESIYGSNIGSLSELESRELVAKTMDLLFQLQEWQTSIRPFTIWGQTEHGQNRDAGMNDNAFASSADASIAQAERYSLCLSVYYYKTTMLVCAPLLMRVLEQVTDSSAPGSGKPADKPPSASASTAMLLEMAVPVLKKELHAIASYQRLANGLLHRQPAFFKANAIWWVCNFNSLTMSLHLFALWLVCMLVDGMPSSLDSSIGGVEALLLEAVSILRGIGGTSMMSIKAYHSLQRYMRLARAIAPMGREQPAHAGQDGQVVHNAVTDPTAPIDSGLPVNFDDLLLHEPQQSALFSSGAFLWDGFPDAGMNYVGDLFYQQMEGDFMGDGLSGTGFGI